MRILRIVGVLIFVYILTRLDWQQMRSVFAGIRLPLLSSAFLLIALLVLTKSTRWFLLVRHQGIEFSFRSALSAYLCGLYLGFVTPGRLGDLIKAVYLKQEAGEPLGSGFANVVFDRLLDLSLLILIGTVGLAYFFYSYLRIWTLLLPLGLLLVLGFFILDRRLGEQFLTLIFRKLELAAKYSEEVQLSFERFHAGLARLFPYTLQAVLLTLLAYAFFFCSSFAIARSLNIEIAFLPFCFAVALASLSTFVPISVSGLGTREAVFITIFHQLGLSSEQAVSYTTLSLIVFNLFIGSIGFAAWQLKGSGRQAT